MPVRTNTWTHPRPARRLTSQAILDRCEVKVLRELRRLRARGWKEEDLDNDFRSQRERADNPPLEAKYAWYNGMARIMRELDVEASVIPPSDPFEFLDLGCAPGGFSAHVLRTNPQARGVGISLSEAQGGNTFLLDSFYSPRYEYIEQDLLEYDFHAIRDEGEEHNISGTSFPPAFLDRFQLVLLDCHPLRAYSPTCTVASEVPWRYSAPGAYSGALLITQFIIALGCVQPGGTIIVKLSHIEGSPAAQLLYLLDTISESLLVLKPRTMHANRSSFYAIAKGVGMEKHAALKGQYLEGLKALWYELKYGRPGGGARGLTETDLDFVVSVDTILDMEGYLMRLIELGRGVWATQVEGLRRFFGKKGMRDLPWSL
ncbi:hypothetical protein BV20DRAFT_775061 [Pilatotrama ljubarskyi]|nr:hypothetical protein BV20DRAFT_775061 [Pilatotrama ljubarskyi]